MIDFRLSSPSHIIFTIICIAMIVILPRLFINKSSSSKNMLIFAIIVLILTNQSLDFYREGYGIGNWKLGLPLHLCDFSSASIIIYLFTKRREFFLFAFFAGISGAGMAILTPDVKYSFPHIDYLRHMIGHSMILLGVAYAIIIDNQRPQLKDVHKVLGVLSVFLLLFSITDRIIIRPILPIPFIPTFILITSL